jgi:hypothetical protein
LAIDTSHPRSPFIGAHRELLPIDPEQVVVQHNELRSLAELLVHSLILLQRHLANLREEYQETLIKKIVDPPFQDLDLLNLDLSHLVPLIVR